MKSLRPLGATAGTLLLHALFLGGVLANLSSHVVRPVTPIPVTVRLIVPPKPLPVQDAPAPQPATPPEPRPAPEPPKPEPPKPEPPKPAPRPEPKPESKPEPKPEPKPRPTPVKPKHVPKPAPRKPAPKPEPAPVAPAEPAPAVHTPEPTAPAPVAPPTPAPAPVAPAAPSAPSAPAAPARTGVSIPASYAASNRKPEYPRMSRRYGEQGTVVLNVLVQADGRAGKVEILKSSGHPRLDEAAKTAIQEWRFNPATVDGKPVAKWYETPFTFTLQD